MANDVTPPLSFFNVLTLHAGGIIRVAVTYQATGLGTGPSEDREAAEHLLEIATEGAKEIIDGLNAVIDETEPNDGAQTKYGALKGLDTAAAEATVKISVHIPGYDIPVEELIFRVNEAFYATLLCMWHVIDPEGYERAEAKEAEDEETWQEPFDMDGVTFCLN